MKTWTFAAVGSLLAVTPLAMAWETDQFNLPPNPLADIGPEISEHVIDSVEKVVADLNREIDEAQACVDQPVDEWDSNCASAYQRKNFRPTSLLRNKRKHLAELRSEDGFREAVYDELAPGFPSSRIEKYIEETPFGSAPYSYRTTLNESIYSRDLTVFLTTASTIQMYGVLLGTDKIGHFFQQGYSYFKTHRDALAEGKTDAEAHAAAIDWSQSIERGFYGTAIVGIYSNADLVANYAGYWFYRGLLQNFEVGSFHQNKLVELKDGHWRLIEPASRARFLAPYISDHLNEALNPSNYNFIWQEHLRKKLSDGLCKRWLAGMNTAEGRASLARADAGELKLWYGHNYGYTQPTPEEKFAGECRAGSELAP